jgi:DNA-binding transcriptional LysR family regulator
MPMDRLAAMETFVRVVDTGSFSAAARQLRIGQPAVSKAMAQLEDRLGVRLLLRSPRGLAMTEAGQNFYERATRAIEEADEADLAARGAGAGLSGRLRFSAAVTFARLHVIPCLPSFLSCHPGLTIEAVLDDRNINPVEEGIDVALRMGDLADSSLTARKIGGCRRLVLATPRYLAGAGEPATPTDLSGHQAVIYAQRGGGETWRFRKDGAELDVTLRDRLRMTAAEGVREAVFAGLGVAVSTEWMFRPELESGRVREVLGDWALPPIDLWAVFPTGRRASGKARAFVDFVETILAENKMAPA